MSPVRRRLVSGRASDAGGGEGFLPSYTRGSWRDFAEDQIAVLIDGEIVSSPHVVQPIRSGNLVITGGFSEEEATALALSVPPFN
jgi:preprotein translocase subunit SecD